MCVSSLMARAWLLALCVVSVACFAPRPHASVVSRRAPLSAPVMMGGAKNGIFTPLVKLTKWVVGEKRFLPFRARVIGEHTKVIQAFVDTADSPFGCMALEKLFEIADVDGSGTIDREELERLSGFVELILHTLVEVRVTPEVNLGERGVGLKQLDDVPRAL